MTKSMQRRDALKIAAAVASAGMAAAQTGGDEPIRVGFVGVGGRGRGLLRNLLKLENVQVPALCDINEENLARAQGMVAEARQSKPEGYSRSETDFRRLCDRSDLDLVINATPWQWHTPISLAAMNAGKHAATEVPAAQTVEECWQLVETSEKTGKHCTVLENDCYYRHVLFVLNIIRAGLLGEVLFAEAGYMHDIRAVKFGVARGGGEPWRLEHSVNRDGNLYPTHPIGPVAWWMDINRGDQFAYLTSMSSKARSLKEFAIKEFGAGDPRSRRDYKLGDVNTTLIRTVKGKTISLYHDTNTPRVKEHIVRVQGTKGAYNDMLNSIYLDGVSPEQHRWEPADEYKKKYDHQLWKKMEAEARGSGHGGGDFMEMYRLVKNLSAGKAPDIDVYDAAAWSVIVPLSEDSVAHRSKPLDFPDFTRGKWKMRAPIDPDEII
jgi:predicted dehydrogenase